jgi:hypothetical protein
MNYELTENLSKFAAKKFIHYETQKSFSIGQ